MDYQLRPAAAAEHRGSYSSVRSAKSQLWTPPHSPTTESMETETEQYDDIDEENNDIQTPVAKPDASAAQTPGHVQDAHHAQPSQATEEQPTELRLSDFQVVDTLGTGTFGRVLLVRLRPPTNHSGIMQHFAMKVLKKTDVVRLRQVEHVNAERYILARIRHPFIVDLYATFQDNLNIYMLLSYVPGGELFSHLRRAHRFSPDVTRFYLAIIVLALRYLHSYNIVYRDLKPENLLLDHRGYLRITDFGFAKVVDDRTWTLCGTPEYLAPEIIQSDGHGKAVDWWACGILCYEMLVGYPPFYDDNAFGIYEKILQGNIHWPQHVDPLSRDLIRAFLHPDRTKRLGNLIGGSDDVLLHPWFRGVDWAALERCEIRAPILPQVTSSGDTRNFSRLPMVKASDIPGLAGDPVPLYSHDPYAEQFADF
ncbi:Protein kinase DC2 [Serendipita indica DSM 11827]|nr:Protein kinase DC2 [Serendipita indica DSM 11827]